MVNIKRLFSIFMLVGVALLPLSGAVQAAEKFKPFVLAFKGPADFDAKVNETRDKLKSEGFRIVGEFTPYEGTHVDKAHVIIVTNDELVKAASMSKLGGFAAPWRIGITKVGDEVQVAYPNPIYIAKAYRLKTDLEGVNDALRRSLGAIETFGSKKGLSARKLRKYHYTFGMEYFDDVLELAEYDSHKAAVDAIEKNLAAGVGGVTKVYRLDLPNDVTVFGVARKAGEKGDENMDDAWIMDNVDFEELKTTAYLPYEILVDGNKVVALHMRFRMALHRPDLKMMGSNSFMNIMPSPKAVEKALRAAAGGK
ncbi:hypothetical protein DFR30_0636 [Thiogranum longum]|uniref:DUF302 domain-containing protein n=1 Tax=Thiogranum longum TaxID=1537524 RepID=A0A4V2PGM7_9GAMM|nr:hypothetical protein [Thiogranum longum]TCK17406.1 hypothetical protein DFR30_0636 [Thiogranum longum]